MEYISLLPQGAPASLHAQAQYNWRTRADVDLSSSHQYLRIPHPRTGMSQCLLQYPLSTAYDMCRGTATLSPVHHSCWPRCCPWSCQAQWITTEDMVHWWLWNRWCVRVLVITIKLIDHSWYYACTLPHWPIIHRHPSYPSPHSCECNLVNSDLVRTNTRDIRMGPLPHFSPFMIFFLPHQLPHLSPFPYLLLLLPKANHPMNRKSWMRTSRDY